MFDNNRETWKWVVLRIGNVLTNSGHFDRNEQGRLYVIEELFGSGVRKAQLCLLGERRGSKVGTAKFISKNLGFGLWSNLFGQHPSLVALCS
jgi:hypothetical protein